MYKFSCIVLSNSNIIFFMGILGGGGKMSKLFIIRDRYYIHIINFLVFIKDFFHIFIWILKISLKHLWRLAKLRNCQSYFSFSRVRGVLPPLEKPCIRPCQNQQSGLPMSPDQTTWHILPFLAACVLRHATCSMFLRIKLGLTGIFFFRGSSDKFYIGGTVGVVHHIEYHLPQDPSSEFYYFFFFYMNLLLAFSCKYEVPKVSDKNDFFLSLFSVG